ncbi:MAG: hypothetical protein FWF72_06410 [Paludibacter sp.]|nr:hypothetical protein [Paludibacter sp.]
MNNIIDKNINLSDYKIIIFTRSMNAKLFELSSDSISLPFKHIRMKNTTALGYFYDLLKYDVDYAINIDEDAFVFDNERLLLLLKYCISNNYVNCGFPDGGVLDVRHENPIVTNPFFNIFDVKKINEKLDYQLIENFDFKKYDYESYSPKHLFSGSDYKYSYNPDPYYPFFLWLNMNFKCLYLNATTYKENDGYTTILEDNQGKPFLYHTWFSRFYEKNPIHTKRINNVYTLCTGKNVRSFNKFTDRINELYDFLGIKYSFWRYVFRKQLKRMHLIKYI